MAQHCLGSNCFAYTSTVGNVQFDDIITSAWLKLIACDFIMVNYLIFCCSPQIYTGLL